MTRRYRELTAATLLLALAVSYAAPAPAPGPAPRLPDEDTLQPLQEAGVAGASLAGEDAALAGDELARDKRKLEAVTQAKFSVKNAVLGFVFGKINSLIDAKTRLIDTLDRQNIEKNKAYGIEPPASGLGGLGGLGGVVTQVLGPKLQLLGPKISAVSGLVGGASGGGGSAVGGGSTGSGGGLGSILSLVTSLSGSSSGGGAGAQGATVDTVDDEDDDDAR